jgi:hypothetical protein
MDKMSIEERVDRLRWYGFNPIHLFGNVYLVRCNSTTYSDLSFYKIEIFKE